MNSQPDLSQLLDDEKMSIFGSSDAQSPMSTSRIPEHPMRPDDAYQLIEEELLLDGNARQNLATFCQTWDDDQVRKLMDLSIDKNLIDKDEYPQSAEIEMRCVRMLAALWNAPQPDHTIGCATIGSSEACMLAGMAALWRWREKRKKEGKSTSTPNLVCGPVQICWHKFCRYWGVEMREVPMQDDLYCMTPEEMLKLVDENTILVMSTFGVTYTGQYEPAESLCKALDELARAGGPDIDMHIDAASGGFLSPFLTPDIPFDFRLKRVKSISTSGHKFGLAPLGCGWVIWREAVDLPRELVFDVNYLGGSVPSIAINFSRPAGQVIAQYYNLVRLGRKGYASIHQSSYDVARYLADEIEKLGSFEFIHRGEMERGIPAICFSMTDSHDAGYNLYELSDRLRLRGWQVPAYSMPANITHKVVMRIMVRQGFSIDLAQIFIRDMQRAIDFLFQHSYSDKLQEDDIMSFKHT